LDMKDVCSYRVYPVTRERQGKLRSYIVLAQPP